MDGSSDATSVAFGGGAEVVDGVPDVFDGEDVVLVVAAELVVAVVVASEADVGACDGSPEVTSDVVEAVVLGVAVVVAGCEHALARNAPRSDAIARK